MNDRLLLGVNKHHLRGKLDENRSTHHIQRLYFRVYIVLGTASRPFSRHHPRIRVRNLKV